MSILLTQTLLLIFSTDSFYKHFSHKKRPTAYIHQLKEFMTKAGLQDRVHFLHGIPSDDLPAIYQSAETFVYPSVYEGFGIPILEALHSGIPVVAATGSCLEEAGSHRGGKGPPFCNLASLPARGSGTTLL